VRILRPALLCVESGSCDGTGRRLGAALAPLRRRSGAGNWLGLENRIGLGFFDAERAEGDAEPAEKRLDAGGDMPGWGGWG
jgi:hypothetical protein